MIVIGIGANLPHAEYGPPRRTCGAALEMLQTRGVRIKQRATWYKTAPVVANPDQQGEQPWYINGAAQIKTDLDAFALLSMLLDVETAFGRLRSIADAPRTLDLDIITFKGQILDRDGLNIPHPRMQERAFVLYPLHDLAPDWVHPIRGSTITEMIHALPTDQSFDSLEDSGGLYGTEWPGTENSR